MVKTKKLLALILMAVFLMAQLPMTVLAENKEQPLSEGGIITAFAELPEDIVWQETLTPRFPEVLEAVVEGKTFFIPVTWKTDRDYNAASPQPGEYIFTAFGDEGYKVAEDLELPHITVIIPPPDNAQSGARDSQPGFINKDSQQAP